MHRIKSPLISFTMPLLIAMMLASCVTVYRGEAPTIEPTMQRFNAGLINAADLPAGWGHRSLLIDGSLGGVGRIVIWYGADPRDKPYVNVSQLIAIYPDEQSSKAAYKTAVEEAIPPAYATDWAKPPELDFQGHADEMTIGCLASEVNGESMSACRVVARYGDMVMRLYGNVFEGHWITMSQFRHLVEQADTRMESARKLGSAGN
jgi:hypothetical protein